MEAFVRGGADAVKPEENAFFSMCAHRVTAGRDPHAEGVAAAKVMDALYRGNPVEVASATGEDLLPVELALKGDATFLMEAAGDDVMERYRGREEAIRGLEENRELVGRYLDLYSHPHFR